MVSMSKMPHLDRQLNLSLEVTGEPVLSHNSVSQSLAVTPSTIVSPLVSHKKQPAQLSHSIQSSFTCKTNCSSISFPDTRSVLKTGQKMEDVWLSFQWPLPRAVPAIHHNHLPSSIEDYVSSILCYHPWPSHAEYGRAKPMLVEEFWALQSKKIYFSKLCNDSYK